MSDERYKQRLDELLQQSQNAWSTYWAVQGAIQELQRVYAEGSPTNGLAPDSKIEKLIVMPGGASRGKEESSVPTVS